MVRGESLVRNLMLLCLSTSIVLLGGQRQAVASERAEQVGMLQESLVEKQLPALMVELPPIGEASQFIPLEEVRLVLRLSQRRVYVYKGSELQASYPVAIGKPGWETPVGTFKVFTMEKDPIFKSFRTGKEIGPGPDNPLGPRWIGIWTDGKTQLGFHGTNEPELIGQAVSHGCIRMHNKDVIALYDQVSVGTTVIIEP